MDYSDILKRLEESGNLRRIPAHDNSDILDFSTNDYLGLARRTDLAAGFIGELRPSPMPFTCSASRLLAANQSEYHALESMIDSLYPGRRSLMFNSGYHANTGLISSLADRHSLVVSDRLVHASIIDGITLSRADHKRFAHNDLNQLEDILKRNVLRYGHIMAVVESVYSMDGDHCDLQGLIDIKKRYPSVMLYVDEAHGFGVCGNHGLGMVSDLADHEMVDVVMGTFGKAAASVGAFAVLSPMLREYAVNRSRSFIFSTAIPPVNAAWTRLMLEVMTGMDSERKHLTRLARKLKDALDSIDPGHSHPESHIQPLIIGDAAATVAVSRKMLEEDGIKVLPIRTPTVPAGTERLRISLSAANSESDIDRLVNSIKKAL